MPFQLAYVFQMRAACVCRDSVSDIDTESESESATNTDTEAGSSHSRGILRRITISDSFMICTKPLPVVQGIILGGVIEESLQVTLCIVCVCQ
jgi:hypothetical protein